MPGRGRIWNIMVNAEVVVYVCGWGAWVCGAEIGGRERERLSSTFRRGLLEVMRSDQVSALRNANAQRQGLSIRVHSPSPVSDAIKRIGVAAQFGSRLSGEADGMGHAALVRLERGLRGRRREDSLSVRKRVRRGLGLERSRKGGGGVGDDGPAK